jgi:hypothetical protein
MWQVFEIFMLKINLPGEKEGPMIIFGPNNCSSVVKLNLKVIYILFLINNLWFFLSQGSLIMYKKSLDFLKYITIIKEFFLKKKTRKNSAGITFLLLVFFQ